MAHLNVISSRIDWSYVPETRQGKAPRLKVFRGVVRKAANQKLRS